MDKLKEPYAENNFMQLHEEMFLLLKDLIEAWQSKEEEEIKEIVDQISGLYSITPEHRFLLRELCRRYDF